VILKQKHIINFISLKHLLLISLIGLTLALFSQESLAKVKAVNFVAGVIRKHDDNIFRTQSDTTSDNITSLSVGLKLDKKISLQRVTGKIQLAKHRYNKNDQLNFTSKEYEAAWYWALTPKLTGKLSADRKERLNNFNDTRTTEKNTRVEQNQEFLADFNPSGGWHYLAGISRQSLKNSNTFTEDTSFSANALDLGLRYVFPSQSSVTLMNHTRRGKYNDREIDQSRFFDDEYKERETGVALDWLITVKSRVKLATSYIKRKHDNFSERDYSGLQGEALYDWEPRKRINIGIKAKSSIASYQTNVDSYRRTNELSLTPSYVLTPKVRIKGGIKVSERKFLGSGYDSQTTSSRQDDYKSAEIGVEWKPTRQSSVALKLSRYDQNSNVNRFDYKGNMIGISGNIEF